MSSQAAPSISLVIIAPVRLYREALAAKLCVPPFVVSGSVATTTEALPLVEQTQPHVVTIDPRDASPRDVHEMRRLSPSTHIVAIALGPDADLLPYAEAGVSGYVAADASLDDLVLVIRDALNGDLRCSPRLAGAC